MYTVSPVDHRFSIKRLRAASGISQQQLADRLGLHKTTVSHWEHGIAMPSRALLPRVAEIFGVTVDQLLRGAKAS